jgi:4-amino-4-deoxy-L-arabinose transferase-like glycosyltransferase
MALSDRTANWSLAAIVVSGVALQLHNLGHEDLTFFDEFFHATVARNLLKHPLLFTLYDTPSVALLDGWNTAHVWLHKPPLAIWQIALSYCALGTTTFALRLPSVLLCAGVALITYRLAIELFRNRGVGLIAAALCALNPFVAGSVHGRYFSDHIDVALLFYTATGLLALARGINTGRHVAYALGGLLLGLAFATKAFPAWITAGILSALYMATRLRIVSAAVTLSRLAVFALTAGAVVAIWAIPSYLVWGEQFVGSVRSWWLHLQVNVEGWGAPLDGYFFNYAIRNFPWFYVPGLMAVGLMTWRGLRGSRSDLFIALWFWGGLIPLSLATSKMPSASLIVLPASALAFGRLVMMALEGSPLALGLWGGPVLASLIVGGVSLGPARIEGWSVAINAWVFVHLVAGIAGGALLMVLARSAKWPQFRGTAQAAAIIASLPLSLLYVRDAVRVTAIPPPMAMRAMGEMIQAEYPTTAVFIMQEQAKLTGNHGSLMFWADRSVYSAEVIGWNPGWTVDRAARALRAANVVPYLISDIEPDGPARRFNGYWISELK